MIRLGMHPRALSDYLPNRYLLFLAYKTLVNDMELFFDRLVNDMELVHIKVRRIDMRWLDNAIRSLLLSFGTQLGWTGL